MRSRYTAYTLGDVDYILKTWADETRHTVNAISLAQSCAQTQYLSLKIVSKIAGTRKHNQGQVEFEVSFISNGKTQTHQEVSNFIKITDQLHVDQWYYVDGNVSVT